MRTAVSDLQQIFHDDPPAIFIAWPKVARVVSAKFVGARRGRPRCHRAAIWQWRADRGSADQMRRITSRFVLLIASAAVAPLVLYGVISIFNLKTGTESYGQRGQSAARRSGRRKQIGQYMAHNTQCPEHRSGSSLRGINIEPWQQSRVLKDYVIDFPEFREITFFGCRRPRSSRRAASARHAYLFRIRRPWADADVFVAPLQLDEDDLPRTTIAVRVTPGGQEPGWVVGEIALEELWRTVDRVRVGPQGYALLVAEEQRLIAHGNPNKKRLVAATATPGTPRTPEQDFAA